VKLDKFAEIDQITYDAIKQNINSMIAILKTLTIVLNVPIEKNNCKGFCDCSGVLLTMLERIATIIVKDASINPANETDAPIILETISILFSLVFKEKLIKENFEFANHKSAIVIISITKA
jgi:hypothetical protein